MRWSNWSVRGPLFLAALLALAVTAVPAQGTALPPGESRQPSDDRPNGELDQILERQEWFYSTRRAGTSSDREMGALRWAAVADTRLAIARRAEKLGQDLGTDVPLGSAWVSKGPSPSNFSCWDFGPVAGRVPALAAHWASGTLYAGTASGGLWKSTDDGLSWTSLFDGAGTMTVGAVTVDPNDPNVLWVGTGENGQNCDWSETPGEGYFGIGLLRSGDGGATWQAYNGTAGNSLEDLTNFASIVVDPRNNSNHILVGGRVRGCTTGNQQNGGLYTSDDGGITWTNRISGQQVHEIRQHPTVLDTYWAATNIGIYKSIDNGVTWTLQTASGLPNAGGGGSLGRTEVAIAPSSGETVYALFQQTFAATPQMWRTTNGGASWSLQSSGTNACDGQCGYNMHLAVHPTDPDTIYRGTIHVFKSVNGGISWTDLSGAWGAYQKVHQDTHYLLIDPAFPDTVYVGCDGGVWKTTDGGATFQNRNGNLNITQFYAIDVSSANTDVICGGAQDNSSLIRTATDVWNLQQATGDGFVCQLDPLDSSYAYTASYPFDRGGLQYPSVLRSDTGVAGNFCKGTCVGGANDGLACSGRCDCPKALPTDNPWCSCDYITDTGSGIIGGDRSNWVTPYVLDPFTPSRVYLGTHRVYRSDNRGTIWYLRTDDLTAGGKLIALEVSRFNSDILYSGSTDGRVWRTTDRWSSSSDISAGLPARPVTDIAADPLDPDRAFATVGGFNEAHLWEWTLAGGWVARGTLPPGSGGLPNIPANTVVLTETGDLFVGTDTGVFYSTDGGGTFEPLMNGLPLGVVVTDLKYDVVRYLLTAGTYGRGVWRIELAQVVANNNDSGVGSLRQAIADTPVTGGTITFDPSLSGAKLDLTTGQILIDKDLAIVGSRLAVPLVIDAGGAGRVFEIANGKTVTLDGLTMTGGQSDYGGAIRNNGTLTVTDSTVSGSSATQQGGGIYNYFGSLTLRRTTLSGNVAGSQGGALWSAGGSFTLANSTVSGNSAPYHAGVVNENGNATVVHSTISDNHATNIGGGLTHQQFGSAVLTIENNVIAGNTAPTGPDVYRNSGTFTPTGVNLIGDNDTVAAEFPADGVLVGGGGFPPVAPGLDALGDWGGPTATMPLLPLSPAIDTAIATALSPTFDQRGWPRAGGANNDLGAVEIPDCGNGNVSTGETCDDGNTLDGDCCSSSCAFEAAATACDLDANACTVDTCDGAGTCLGGDPLTCADGNGCTDDTCDPASGCVFAPNTAACDDGDACTSGDVCSGGACLSGTIPGSLPAWTEGLAMDPSRLSWSPHASATAYDVVAGDLGTLRGSGGEFSAATKECLAENHAPTELDVAANPPPGSGTFYLVRGANCSGSGTYDTGSSTQATARDPGVDAAAITCTTSCQQDTCGTGPALDPRCGDCEDAICTADSYCCEVGWDSTCVGEVRTVCSSLHCDDSAGSCSHSVCMTGAALTSGCDDPPVSPSCAGAICAVDSYCCTTSWDGICVGMVDSVCGYSCDGPVSKRVFVSSSTQAGNLGGLAGGDAICQGLADAALLGGAWKAWLSDSTAGPATRFGPWAGSYARVDGVIIANDWADLTDGTLAAPISVTETGAVLSGGTVQTGTDVQGFGVVTSPGPYCLDWTSSAGAGVATIVRGWATDVDGRWTNAGTAGCANVVRIYCFEQ